MALVIALLTFSAICWVIVFWGLKTRSRRMAETRTATDCRRMDPDRLPHARRREHRRPHLRVVSSGKR